MNLNKINDENVILRIVILCNLTCLTDPNDCQNCGKYCIVKVDHVLDTATFRRNRVSICHAFHRQEPERNDGIPRAKCRHYQFLSFGLEMMGSCLIIMVLVCVFGDPIVLFRQALVLFQVPTQVGKYLNNLLAFTHKWFFFHLFTTCNLTSLYPIHYRQCKNHYLSTTG